MVHFERNGDRSTTPFGIPGYMIEELERITSFFESHDIPVRRD